MDNKGDNKLLMIKYVFWYLKVIKNVAPEITIKRETLINFNSDKQVNRSQIAQKKLGKEYVCYIIFIWKTIF